MKSYKYLGIVLDDSREYLTEQEKAWQSKSSKCLRQLHAQTLWACSRYEISKVYWKAVAVPNLTYGNAAITMSRRTRHILERDQRGAARWALGIPGHPVASAFVDNELQWSTFEKREAQSKIRYSARISTLPLYRWPRAILTMMETSDCKTRWYRRVEELKRLYRCSDLRVQLTIHGEPRLKRYNAEVEKRVTITARERMYNNMTTKTSLATYRTYAEQARNNTGLYSNDRGSSLLALARAGMLPTRQFRRHFEQGIQTHCVKCGMEPETVEHVVLECNPALLGEHILIQRLGLTDPINHAAVRETKRILKTWEAETRTIR